MRTLETERLILGPFTPNDAEALHREIYSDPEVLHYYNGGKCFTLEEVQAFLPRRFGGHQFGYWAVIRKEDNQLLGQVHLDAYVNAGWYELSSDDPLSPFHNLEVHLGFAFGKRFWGKGYAEEACRPVIRFAFADLHLRRLMAGADVSNSASVRLHERLGYRCFLNADGTSVTAILDNPLTKYIFRPYQNEDRAALKSLGTSVIDWWHAKGEDTSVHLVAVQSDTGEIVGHLQVTDQSVPAPTRRPGQIHFTLHVASEHRQFSIGGHLYKQAEAFARRRKARLLYVAYSETPDAPATAFLHKRGFKPLEHFHPSCLDLENFDPAQFHSTIERMQEQVIRLLTYAEVGDSTENRRKLYELEQTAHGTQPFREVAPYIPEPWERWEQDFQQRDTTAIFLAIAPQADTFIGVVTGLEWYFTGIHPDWCGRGIATALKVNCLAEAKKRGFTQMETENHGDNMPMLAINRKLGFVFTTPEVACIKRL